MAGTFECGNETSGSIKSEEIFDSSKPVSLSRRTLHHGVLTTRAQFDL